MIGATVSHYSIVDKLGSGGMGEVYAAEDTHLARMVAIKFPLLEADGPGLASGRQFLAEARAASKLDHPNIARIYDYGEAPDGRPFLVMELVTGDILSHPLRGGPLPAKDSVRIVDQVLRALADAHRHGFVHRDIKPGNVMVTKAGIVKVLDFGLAKAILDSPSGSNPDAETRVFIPDATVAGVVRGTPEYMSPEQARGLRLDHRSDLFSTGLVLYQCLTGRSPFGRATTTESIAAVLDTDPVPPSSLTLSVPKALDAITRKALAKDPAQRYQHADDMIADLTAAEADMTRTGSARMLARAARTASSVPRWIWVAGIVVALAAPAGWLMVRERAHVPPAEATAWYERGALALRDGAPYRAAKALEQAVARDPAFSLAHARLAEARAGLDDADGANREMLAALPGRPDAAPHGVAALYMDAIRRTLVRDFSGAIASYRELTSIVPATERAAVLVDIGRLHERNGEATKAIDAYREAVQLDPQSAAGHLRLAVMLARQNAPEAAGEFDQALQLHRALGNPEGEAEVLYRRAMAAIAQRKLQDARTDLEQAVVLADAVGSQYQQIAARLQLSVVAMRDDQLEKATALATAVLDDARRAGFSELVARGLVDLGNTHMVKGEYGQAEATFQQALDAARRSAMRETEARALVSLASVHQQMGVSDRVVSDLEPALAFFQQAGFRREAMSSLTLLARAQRNMGKSAEALAAFQQLLSLAQAQKDDVQMALAYQGIGSVHERQGRLPEALDAFQHESTAAATGAKQDQAYAEENKASALWQLGRYEEAADALKAARVIAGPGAASPLAAQLTSTEAHMALGTGRFRDAIGLARQLMAATSASASARAEAQCVAGLGLARTGAGQEGRRLCEQGRAALQGSNDRSVLARADLLLAEILLATGAAREAHDVIREAIGIIDAAGNNSWWAWALASQAYRLAGDPTQAAEAGHQASTRLAELRSAWGPAIDRYLQRPDVRAMLKDVK